ncbi:MAG: MFS transporter [Oceanicaulis sp.]
MAGKRLSLAIIALCQVLALSVWFAGAAALPGLEAVRPLSPFTAAALSSAVQLGFVAGALASALTGLSDRFDPRAVFAAGAALAGLTSLLCLIAEPGGPVMIGLRLLAGAALALVYPVGMKLAASWAKGDAGFLVGLLVGALTLGSALPHLAAPLLGTVDWRAPYAGSAALALLASALIFAARPGPAFARAPFKPGAVFLAFKRKDIAAANIGYLGHMWELYAFWAWTGAFIAAWRVSRTQEAGLEVNLFTFAVVAAGAAGALLAGKLADRFGRAEIAGAALAVSGACALLSPLAWGAPGFVLGILLLVYGISVIADSAQFSAAIAELAPPGLAGSLLTLQTALGFALTVVSVQLLPVWAEAIGWRYALLPLAAGPVIGVAAMVVLRREMRRRA